MRDEPLEVVDIGERRLLEMIAGYAAIADLSARIRWINRAPLGRSPQRYVNTDLLQYMVEEQRPIVRDAIDRIREGVPVVKLELRSADSGRWFAVRFEGIYRRGRPDALFVHALDIDDAKRDRMALAIERARRGARDPAAEGGVAAEAQRRFEIMADALPMLISYVDRDRRYQYNNAAYERWFGVSRERLRGSGLEEVLGATACAEIRPYVDAALSGKSVRFELSVPYRDAGVRMVVARYVPDMTTAGEVAGFYALIEDVTAQREAEAALRQREEELRQLQRMEALGQLAGGIAHEFGNLLMTVISGCTAVREALDGASPVAKMLARVERAAKRGRSLTQQLLAFSSMSELQTGPVQLDAIVEDVAVLLNHLLGSRIELEVNLGASAWIFADPGQIQQLLLNLALNARDAMSEGGLLRVVTSREALTASQAHERGLAPGSYAVLTVSDTGIGMDEPTRARIFDPFFTTKAPGQGTGLGLSTVFGIVRQAGGHVEVESALGQGTVFRIWLPVSEAEPSRAS